MKKYFIKLTLILVIGFSFTSCEKTLKKSVKLSLELADENDVEIQKVLDHYSHSPKDSLKLKAAKYLIENIIYHSYTDFEGYFDIAFEKTKKSREFYKKKSFEGRLLKFNREEEIKEQKKKIKAKVLKEKQLKNLKASKAAKLKNTERLKLKRKRNITKQKEDLAKAKRENKVKEYWAEFKLNRIRLEKEKQQKKAIAQKKRQKLFKSVGVKNEKEYWALKKKQRIDKAELWKKAALEKRSKTLREMKYDPKEVSINMFRVFSKTIDSIKNFSEQKLQPITKYDIRVISSQFLIENIDLAFRAYDENPLKLCKNFNDFLEYVLPYRVIKEPIEFGKRRELFEKYKWVMDSLKIKPLEMVLNDLNKAMELSGTTFGETYSYNFPGIPNMSQIEATGFGNCDYLSAYYVNVLRAVGIPAGIDTVAKWGNHYDSVTHSWVFYLTNDGFETINPGSTGETKSLLELYKNCSITKVFRKSFGNDKDVTKDYHACSDINIEMLWEFEDIKKKDVFLGVFSSVNEWDKIDSAFELKENKALFKNIGLDIYYVLFTEKKGEKILLNYPFELTKNKRMKFLKPNGKVLAKSNLLRKYPPYTIRNRKSKEAWVESINNCVFQGADNKEFNNFKSLYKFTDFSTTHNVKINLNNKDKYKYYRLISEKKYKKTHLANFKPLDLSGKKINNFRTIKLKDGSQKQLSKITDENQISYVERKGFELVYEFSVPTVIGGFEVQARNDDNHINIGESYELFYWDKNWISLGERNAKDTVLKYQKIPTNTLYWLKNHTKGKEEFVFKFNDKGEQVW